MNDKHTNLISIITVVYNGEKFIENAIQSVINQTYKNIEYIIIDGDSKDKTVDIIKKYEHKISYWISEKDSGLYDAMNKGIKATKGDIIGIINSDDFYADDTVLEKVQALFEKNPKTQAIYSDLVYVDADDTNKVVRYWNSDNIKSFKSGWHPAHPTFFVKRDLYEKYGLFDTSFKISADYELMLRFIEKNKILLDYLPQITVKMRIGGVSNKNISNIINANLEVLRAWKKNNLKVSTFIFFMKPLKKIKQLFKKGK